MPGAGLNFREFAEPFCTRVLRFRGPPKRELESRACHPLVTTPFVPILRNFDSRLLAREGAQRVFRRLASSTPRILQQFVSQLFRNRVVIKLLNAFCLPLESALDV